MPRTYSPEQQTYLEAKAAYQTALADHEAILASHHFYELLETAADEVLVSLEVEAQHRSRLDERMDAFLKAETALFAWGEMQAMRARRARSQQDEVELLQNLFRNIHRYPHLKEKLAGICLQLDVTI